MNILTGSASARLPIHSGSITIEADVKINQGSHVVRALLGAPRPI
ncbi:hypothetical protein [Methylomicrobium lacus]|nr:hypothetical protein [Methylomicrobium lacus]